MKAFIFLAALAAFLMLVLASHAEPLELSGSSPDMAKQFAADNSLVPFQHWIMQAFGPMQSEILPELDSFGRPTSILNYSTTIPDLPESVKGNDSGNESFVIINDTTATVQGVPLPEGMI